MIRVSVSYPKENGARFDMGYYMGSHVALVKKKFGHHGLVRIEVDEPLDGTAGGPPTIVVIMHLYFETLEGFQQAMKDHGAEVVGDVPNYTDLQPQLHVSEVVQV